MIFDIVEQCYTVTAAQFATAYSTLLTAKSVTPPATAFTLIKRQDAETFTELGGPLPAMGIYCRDAGTRAKDQTKRDTLGLVTWDVYAEGADPKVLAEQVELAAEALLIVIDALAGSGLGVFGGGELDDSVRIKLSSGFEHAEETNWWHRAVVTAPVHDRDEPL